MQTWNQEMKKIEESLKGLKDQTQNQEWAIQEIHERQSWDIDEMRNILIRFESLITSQMV